MLLFREKKEDTMAVTWKNEFSIKVREIDLQHQELFARLGRLQAAIGEGAGAEKLAATFRFLDDYVRRHFAAEEALQQRFRYPHLPLHAAEHRHFEAELARLEERMQLEGASEQLAHLTDNVLSQWLINHVCTIDRQLAGYINQNRNEEWERWLKANF
jgi:hemerythrin